MQAVIDTNAIVGDYWLRSQRWRLLLSRGENDLVEIHVPEAVIAETIKHYGQDLAEAARSLSVAQRAVRRVLPGRTVDALVDIDAEVEAYEEELRGELQDAGASFDYPEVDTGELAQMAIERRKPFKADGSGYVDAVVWLLARELAEDDEVALISNNYKDFGGTKQGGLDATLEAQLADRGIAGQVTRYPSPTEFHVAALDHAELYDAEIRNLLADPGSAEAIEQAMFDLLDDRLAREVAAWGSVAGSQDTFFVSGEIRAVELIEVTDAAPDYGYAAFLVQARASYEFPVLYSEAWEAYENDELDDLEVDDPEHIIGAASRTVNLDLTVDARYDPVSQALSEFEFSSAELS